MSGTRGAPAHEVVDSANADSEATKCKRILLVEGDGFTRLVLLLRLRLAGFGVDFTSNGILGLRKLRSCCPDILLIELKLCGLSGLDLIKIARAEPTFGNRPIYVFTHADRMNRTNSKEVRRLATALFDKNLMTREDVVKTLVNTFRGHPACNASQAIEQAARPHEALSEAVLPQAIEEIIGGVREQAEQLARCTETGAQAAIGIELLSRVCSLAHCATAARLPNLARQAKALENFLNELRRRKQSYTASSLNTIMRSMEVMGSMSFNEIGKQQSLSRFTVVIVDEVPSSNQALKEAMLQAGFQPVCFEGAERVREHLASNRTGLIIVNLRLPEGHGLALRDIRQFPLHAKTPVLFGPESMLSRPFGEDLETGAARLDADPLLLAELVLSALNRVQNPDEPAPGASSSASTAPNVAPQLFGAPEAPATQPFEDGIELFAPPRGRKTAAALHSSGQTAMVAAEGSSRAQSATIGGECTAEFLARLPEDSFDESQIDQRPVEVLPTSSLQAEVSQSPGPESTAGDQTANVLWLATAGGDLGRPVPEGNSASEFAPNDPGQVQESPDNEEVMKLQLQAVPAEYRQQGQEGQPVRAASEQQDAEARCAELEQEVAALRQAFEHFSSFGQEQPAPAEAGRDVELLEQRLAQTAAELAEQREAQRRGELDLRQDLESANAARQQSEAAREQAKSRCAQLEQELADLRKARPEPTPTQNGSANADAPAGELELQVRQGVAALARATAELAKERGERQRSDQRVAELNVRLQALHEDLRRTLQAQQEDLARLSALEEEQRQTSQALDQRAADLEQEQAERRLAEEQLQKAKDLNTQLRKDLAFFEDANKKFGGSRQDLQNRLESSLAATRENEARLQQEAAEKQRLAKELEAVQRELQEQSRRHEILQQELQVVRESLQDREAKLHQEAAERQRLAEALNSAVRSSHDGSERDLELSKLESALQLEQVERQRQDTQLARLRQKARDATQAARALRTSLRRQIREPVDSLVHSARSLLELEMGEAQKQLAEAVLQDVLLVQTRLRDPELPHGDPAETAAPPTRTPA